MSPRYTQKYIPQKQSAKHSSPTHCASTLFPQISKNCSSVSIRLPGTSGNCNTQIWHGREQANKMNSATRWRSSIHLTSFFPDICAKLQTCKISINEIILTFHWHAYHHWQSDPSYHTPLPMPLSTTTTTLHSTLPPTYFSEKNITPDCRVFTELHMSISR